VRDPLADRSRYKKPLDGDQDVQDATEEAIG
jgi:hypothetical protein